MVSFLSYLYLYYITRRRIWLKKKLSFFKVVVLYSWCCSSRESHAQLIALLWAVFGSSRESHAIVLQTVTKNKEISEISFLDQV